MGTKARQFDVTSYFSSLTTKIIISFIVITLFFVGTMFNNYLNANKTSSNINHVVSEAIPIFEITSNVSENALRYEPLVIDVTESYDIAHLTERFRRVEEVKNSIAAELSKIETLPLNPKLERQMDTALDQLEREMVQVDQAMQLIEETQKSLITTFEQFNQIVSTFNTYAQALNPLVDQILEEIYDEYLISQLNELLAMANYGLYEIRSVQGASDDQALESLTMDVNDWIDDFKLSLTLLPFDYSEENAFYRESIPELNRIANGIIDTTQGVLDEQTQQRQDGLLSTRRKLVQMQTKQRQNIKEFQIIIEQLLESASKMVDVSSAEVARYTDETQAQLTQQKLLGLASGAVVTMLVMGISIMITRTFKRVIGDTTRHLNVLAKGELWPVEQNVSNDEFGQIKKAINQVTLNLREIVQGISHANSSMDQRIFQVTEQSEQTLSFADQQRSELDSIATALTQMAQTSDEVANHASSTHEKINNAGELSSQSKQAMLDTRSAIDTMSAQSKATADIINSLNEGVQQIESILLTINGIAEKTNLLALNAAIEAARAGEQGRGFAVVADEVRALAGHTQQSTVEVKEKTELMLRQAAQAVEAIAQSQNVVNNSVTSAEVANQSVERLAVIMDEIKDLSHLIATASEEQAATVNTINENVLQVSNLAESTQVAAHSMKDDSVSLRELASGLTEQVSQFHIKGTSDHSP